MSIKFRFVKSALSFIFEIMQLFAHYSIYLHSFFVREEQTNIEPIFSFLFVLLKRTIWFDFGLVYLDSNVSRNNYSSWFLCSSNLWIAQSDPLKICWVCMNPCLVSRKCMEFSNSWVFGWKKDYYWIFSLWRS
jgi:hypothetical protein